MLSDIMTGIIFESLTFYSEMMPFYSLSPSDTHGIIDLSTLVQVMAYCLIAPGFIGNMCLVITFLKLLPYFPMANELKMATYSSANNLKI